MSKVEELLAKYNPEGVDNIPLWELTAWDKKFNAVDKSMQKKVIKYKYYLAKDLDALVDDTGDIRILYTNEKVAYTSEEKCNGNICEGEIVAIPWGGTPTVKYYNGKFVTGDNRIATSLDTKILNNKYLFYWMISQLGTIADFYRGAGIQHPSMSSVLSMEIPLPHIKVQEEIVKILDSFTNLIDALNEELSLRQKQFEYYREKLLTFDEEPTSIFKFTKVLRGKRLTTKELSDNAKYPVYHGGTEPIGYYNEYNRDANTVMVINVGASAGTIGSCNQAFWSSDGYYCLSHNQKIHNKFLYYSLLIREYKIKSQVRYAGIPTLDQKVIENIQLFIPSLAIQQSIVEKLDAFESLISSLKEEIALRQKQYEYYREKLLTFD